MLSHPEKLKITHISVYNHVHWFILRATKQIINSIILLVWHYTHSKALVYYIQAIFYKSSLIAVNWSVIKVTLFAHTNTNESGLIIHTIEIVLSSLLKWYISLSYSWYYIVDRVSVILSLWMHCSKSYYETLSNVWIGK